VDDEQRSQTFALGQRIARLEAEHLIPIYGVMVPWEGLEGGEGNTKEAAFAEVTRILGDLGISIEAILQKEPTPDAADVPIIMLSHLVQERQMNEAIRKIEALEAIHGNLTRIRLEHLDCD